LRRLLTNYLLSLLPLHLRPLPKDLLRLLKDTLLLAHLSRRLPKDLLHLSLLRHRTLHLRLLSHLLLRSHLRHLPLLGRTTAAISATTAATLLSRRTSVRITATAAFTLTLAKTVLIQTAQDKDKNGQCR
jgi:hypothetical protein